MLNRAVFVHVPKCGGTTITLHLKKMFPDYVYPDQTYRRYRRNGVVCYPMIHDRTIPKFCARGLQDPGDNCRVITGHYSVDKWRHLGWPIFSMVRDPVERIISYYTIWNYRHREKIGWGLREFAEFTRCQMSIILGSDLSALTFIGLTERYDESIKRIEDILGIKFPNPIGRYNKTYKKLKVSNEDKEFIRDINRRDVALYEKIKERFE